jgi:hypothetical protein
MTTPPPFELPKHFWRFPADTLRQCIAERDAWWQQHVAENYVPRPERVDAAARLPAGPADAYAVGTILRYDRGKTALMRVDTISANHGGKGEHRYYGAQCMGGLVGAYHTDCKPADAADVVTWARCHPEPKEQTHGR